MKRGIDTALLRDSLYKITAIYGYLYSFDV